jgi:hypothetical protein
MTFKIWIEEHLIMKTCQKLAHDSVEGKEFNILARFFGHWSWLWGGKHKIVIDDLYSYKKPNHHLQD